jgi:hypothetical protein
LLLFQECPDRSPLDELGDHEVSDDDEEVKVHDPPAAEVVAATIAAAAKAEVCILSDQTGLPDFSR